VTTATECSRHAGRLQGEAAAAFSPCGRYRWWLQRQWEPRRPRLIFIGLNPSRADHRRDDPTLRRLVGLARGWGFGGLEVLNLFAWISPSPAALCRQVDPVGTDADRWLLRRLALHPQAPVWLGWGAQADRSGRSSEVLALLQGRELRAIGRTRSGQPRHPLYAPASARLEPWCWRDPWLLGHPGLTRRLRPAAPPCPASPGAMPSICT
jgi:hypothetical protein